MPIIARCTATLGVDEVILTMKDGTVHSRICLHEPMDALERLERITESTMPVQLLWAHEDLDTALGRYGWRRIGPWTPGPSAEVFRDEL